MNSMITKAVVTGAAAAVSVGLGIGPAAAATVTVSGGPNFAAVSTNTVLATGTVTISCTKSVVNLGNVVEGTYTVPAQIGVIISSKWGSAVSSSDSCTAFGAPATVTQNGTWQIWVTGAQSGGITPEEIRNIDATVSVPSLGCTVTVTGKTPADWNNNQTLTFTTASTSALVTSGSGFCLGLGSTGQMSGSFAVTATDNSGNPSPIYLL